MSGLRTCLDGFRGALLYPLLYVVRRAEAAGALARDLSRDIAWRASGEIVPLGTITSLRALSRPQTRSVVYGRLRQGASRDRLAARLYGAVFPETPGFELFCHDIGPGLYVAHGFGSVVQAESIGRDCTIHQHVTVGSQLARPGYPRIGDHVLIGAGAIILGAITIGDDAVVGAGAVVTRDVAPGATVVGNPAKPIGAAAAPRAQ
jgi:serine O-acetyltransferase